MENGDFCIRQIFERIFRLMESHYFKLKNWFIISNFALTMRIPLPNNILHALTADR